MNPLESIKIRASRLAALDQRRSRRWRRWTLALATAGVSAAAGTFAAPGTAGATVASAASGSCTYYLVSFQGAINTFMAAEQKGVQAAGKTFGVHAVFEGPSTFSVPQQVSLLRSAAASHPCGIATGLADPTALNAPIDSVLSQHIPVVLWNVQSFPGAKVSSQIAALPYVGQDETHSGAVLATHLLTMLKPGDHVVFGVDTPGELVAQERFNGIKQTLAAHHITTTLLNVGADITAGVGIYQAYLAAHPDVQAIVSNAATTAQAADEYISRQGLQKKYVLASFDMASPIVSYIENGTQRFVLDQQPYLQGYMAIEDLVLAHEGFTAVNVNTGTLFVDKSNIAAFKKLTAKGIGA